jgi:1-acyl-sn-glycerol-3-phosphate acyltransferase
MIDLFNERKKLVVLVTPEGTRSRVEKWKTGFYYVAKGAHLPIALGFVDYKKKLTGVGKMIYPSGNLFADMNAIMEFYQTITPRFPENYSVDIRFLKPAEVSIRT